MHAHSNEIFREIESAWMTLENIAEKAAKSFGRDDPITANLGYACIYMMYAEQEIKGNPNKNSECLFNYSSEGAITSCVYDNMITQVIIFDQHGEHFNYDAPNLVLDENEPTTRFSSEILKKISFYKNDHLNTQLHDILQNNQKQNLNEIQTAPKSIEPEKSVIQGVTNFSCTRDDFGLITISGQYNNDDVQRQKVDLEISFLDNERKTLGKTTATFYNLQEFESKRFVGHSKWSGTFNSCNVVIN